MPRPLAFAPSGDWQAQTIRHLPCISPSFAPSLSRSRGDTRMYLSLSCPTQPRVLPTSLRLWARPFCIASKTSRVCTMPHTYRYTHCPSEGVTRVSRRDKLPLPLPFCIQGYESLFFDVFFFSSLPAELLRADIISRLYSAAEYLIPFKRIYRFGDVTSRSDGSGYCCPSFICPCHSSIIFQINHAWMH